MTRLSSERQSIVPAVVMICFTILLVLMLVLRVYQADRDLGHLRVSERQARLAAESGVDYTLEQIRHLIATTDRVGSPEVLTSHFFSSQIEADRWITFGQRSDAAFRVLGIRKVHPVNNPGAPLLNENYQFQLIVEGRSGVHKYSTSAIIQLYDLVKSFAVFSSLDEYYYGNPIQPWIESSGGLDYFIQANQQLFATGKLSRLGVAQDAEILHKMFRLQGADPFNAIEGGSKLPTNYGSVYFRGGESMCRGPIYCETPVVVDSHVFWGPVQTAWYFYRRGSSQPRINQGNTVVAVNSSKRVQKVIDTLEGKNPSDMLIDRDAAIYSSHIPPWRPEFNYFRQLSRDRGIYIDAQGRGFLNGKPFDTDYHSGETMMYSDSYILPVSTRWEQDELNKEFVVLSTDANYDGYNNISAQNLQGARLVFSERSVFLRGGIGNDLIIVTPGHIFITGPTNVDSNLNLMLVAAQGTALSTADLENFIKENRPTESFIDAAREWHINAVIYKPGSGVYTSAKVGQGDSPINFRNIFGGKSLRVKISGACVGGNLQRWLDNTERGAMQVEWRPESVDRLMIRPITANVLTLRSQALY